MVPAATRRFVRARAGGRCEYCRMPQSLEPFITYQIEHVVAIQHGGGDDEANLALACAHCNLHKGTNLAGIDPITGAVEVLFHPCRQAWEDHFDEIGTAVVGRTPCGRATVQTLAMNAPLRAELRSEVG